jgi:hypothetical protein
MSFFDLLALLPFDLPSSGSRPREPGEGISGALALAVFPAADFAIVLFGPAWTGLAVPTLVVPAAFTGVSVLVTRLLGTSVSWTVRVAVGCAALCFVASGFAFLLRVFASFYSSF